jgi:hypothetical protein
MANDEKRAPPRMSSTPFVVSPCLICKTPNHAAMAKIVKQKATIITATNATYPQKNRDQIQVKSEPIFSRSFI